MRGLLFAYCLLSAAGATIVVDTGHDKRLNHRADGKHAAVASPVLRAADGVLTIRAPPAAVAVDTYSATLFAFGDAHLSIRGALARPLRQIPDCTCMSCSCIDVSDVSVNSRERETYSRHQYKSPD